MELGRVRAAIGHGNADRGHVLQLSGKLKNVEDVLQLSGKLKNVPSIGISVPDR